MVQPQPKLTARDLIGRWVSAQPENLDQFYGIRDLVLTEHAWALIFTVHDDEKGHIRLFSVRAEGTYHLSNTQASLPGAHYITLRFIKRYVTVFMPAMLEIFKRGNTLTWALGQEVNVSLTGANHVPSVSAVPIEYDLVKLEGNQLWLGDRSIDLSKQRAQKLDPYPLNRR